MRMLLLMMCAGCLEYDIHKQPYTNPPVEGDTSDLQTEQEQPQDTSSEVPQTETEIDGIPIAQEVMYVHTSTILYSYNAEGETGTIGQFYIENDFAPNITDLAIDLNGSMYAVSVDALYRVDPTDARLEHVSDLAIPLYGLTFLADGRLLGAGDGIYWVEPISGLMAEFVSSGNYQTSGDIVGLPDGKLYWTVIGGDGLVVVDPVTGQTDYIGDIGIENLWGVGYYDNALFGFSSAGSMCEINPANAEVVAWESTSGQYWWGAASNPVHWD